MCWITQFVKTELSPLKGGNMKKEKWFQLLVEGNKEINLERVDSLEEINGLETLEYVFRTLEYLITYGKERAI